jgi:hypothetical protein
MTNVQKDIINKLLQGFTIAGSVNYGYRLRSPEGHVHSKLNPRSFYRLKPILRKTKVGLFVANKSKIRQQHGNSFIKKEYRVHQNLKNLNP